MFPTPAFAQAAGAPAGGDPLSSLLVPMLLMLVIFYFLLIRPQQQRQKEHREMMGRVRRGDTVVTSNGFIGKVSKATEGSDEIEVELNEQMKVRVLKSTLIDVRSKNEPVKDAAGAKS
jgi:preprotein translocase subunit YajC